MRSLVSSAWRCSSSCARLPRRESAAAQAASREPPAAGPPAASHFIPQQGAFLDTWNLRTRRDERRRVHRPAVRTAGAEDRGELRRAGRGDQWTPPPASKGKRSRSTTAWSSTASIAGFMIQGGDPQGNGTRRPGLQRSPTSSIPTLRFDQGGTAGDGQSRARTPTAASSSSRSRPRLARQQAHHLRRGRRGHGRHQEDRQRPTGKPGDRPVTPVVMKTVTILRIKE